MELDEFFDIDIRDPVAVGEHKRFVSHIFFCAKNTPSGHGVQACVDESDPPRFAVLFMDGHLVLFQIEGNVASVQEVVCEIFFDDISFVSEENDEVVVSIARVYLHDVPEDRVPADFDHGFRDDTGFFGKACAHTAGEDEDFHDLIHLNA